ncbi:MAG TPA: xanthine dehydrogenase family protein subunit M [Thermodesulfobacteriota bacterium]|nr:xanthine dehydrogenase family protein subunit M [Thermodesulfobacteriota bacterium]
MKKFDYFRPKTLEEALRLLAQHGEKAKLIAGGTDVIVMIKQKAMAPDVLISLQGIPGLDQIQYNGSLSLGPMVTHRAIEKSAVIRENFSALADAVDDLGSIQIRNVATLGGNLCTAAPSADTATPLLVLRTQVKIKSAQEERTLPIEEFFKGPGETALKTGEMVKELSIPKPLPNTGSAYYKLQRRLALDLPILGVSVLLSLDKDKVTCSDLLCTASPISTILHKMEEDEILCREVRIALGVAAPTPMRAVKAEALLRGKTLSDELLEEAANTASQEAQPRDTLRGEAWYRRDMVRVLVKRMAMKSIERVVQPEETIFPERLW